LFIRDVFNVSSRMDLAQIDLTQMDLAQITYHQNPWQDQFLV